MQVKHKYNATLADLFRETFCWLPLAHVLNGRVLVVHGGLFSKDGVTLDDLRRIDRYRWHHFPNRLNCTIKHAKSPLPSGSAQRQYESQLVRGRPAVLCTMPVSAAAGLGDCSPWNHRLRSSGDVHYQNSKHRDSVGTPCNGYICSCTCDYIPPRV